MPGSHDRLSCGKRPLEQSFSKEPEHRKRPNRYVCSEHFVNNISNLHCCLVSAASILQFCHNVNFPHDRPSVLAMFLKRPAAGVHSLRTQCLWLLRRSVAAHCLYLHYNSKEFPQVENNSHNGCKRTVVCQRGVLCCAGALIQELMLHCTSTIPQTA